MSKLSRPLVATFVWLVLLLTGCQQAEDGASAPPATAPPATATTAAQEANSAVEALSLSSTIATDAILSAGSGQSVATSDKETASSTTSAAVSADAEGFTFATTGMVTVDLDAMGPSGDRYPHATGTFSVAYDSSGNGGPVIGSPVGSAGIVAYNVTVTALSNCTFTDPRCNATATIASGSSYTYEVEITWNWSDADHWTAQSDVVLASSALSVSGSRPGATWSAALSGSRHAFTALGYNAGTLSLTRTVTADWTVDTMRNGIPHIVVWHRPALDRIFVTVDGTTYGPYTLAQVWWYWNVSCH
jgi:hypothetical protein